MAAFGFVASESTGHESTLSDVRNSFDGTRSVVLQGDAARELAEWCGAPIGSSGWTIHPADIKDLERELALLLADDLKSVGSAATPNQYYRQYASGRFAGRDGIFINGFHESYLSIGNDAGWRSHVVRVSDGGENFWCAIYMRASKQHFVTYKERGRGYGSTHVSFHGLG
jgi:hypothetical protein